MRFLASVVAGWALLRVVMLWGDDGKLPEVVRAIAPLPHVAMAAPRPVIVSPIAIASPSFTRRRLTAPVPTVLARPAPNPLPSAEFALLPQVALAASVPVATPVGPIAGVAPTQFTLPPSPRANRWSASGWAFVRGDGRLGAAPGSQLGGSQVGLRVDRAIVSGFALTGRVAAPLQGRGAEGAVGLAWQAARLPLRVVAEQRIAIDGGRGGPALGISTGVSDVALPQHFRLDAYGQAGAIARGRVDGYADGAVRVARAVVQFDAIILDIGAGAWGAAQRDAARLDIGPSAALRLPVAGGGARLSFDWRERVAGDARPGSGPTITLGADF